MVAEDSNINQSWPLKLDKKIDSLPVLANSEEFDEWQRDIEKRRAITDRWSQIKTG